MCKLCLTKLHDLSNDDALKPTPLTLKARGLAHFDSKL